MQPTVDGGTACGSTLLRQCREAFDKGKIMAASRLRRLLLDKYRASFDEDRDLMRQVQEQAHVITEVLRCMQLSDRWTCTHVDEQATVYYDSQIATGNPRDVIMIDALVNAPIFEMLVLGNEVPLYARWLSLMHDSNYLEPRTHLFSAKAWWKLASPVPWLVHHREVYVQMQIFDCLSEDGKGSFYIVMTDVPEKELPFGLSERSQRLYVHRIAFRMTLMRGGALRVTGVGDVDAQLRYLPHFAINWLAAHVCCKGLNAWVQAASDMEKYGLPQHFEAAVDNNKEFYDWIAERIKQQGEQVREVGTSMIASGVL